MQELLFDLASVIPEWLAKISTNQPRKVSGLKGKLTQIRQALLPASLLVG